MAVSEPAGPPEGAKPAKRARGDGDLNAAVVVGGFLAFGSILLAVFGPLLAPYPPMDANPGQQLLAPSGEHWFGTDDVGMDVFSRVIAAPRIDLGIALSATVLALAIGTAIGGIAGYFRTWWSELIMRISDLIQSFPVFILAMVLVTITGQEIWIVIAVIAFVNVPLYVRLIRAELLSLRERTFVEAAIVLGVPPLADHSQAPHPQRARHHHQPGIHHDGCRHAAHRRAQLRRGRGACSDARMGPDDRDRRPQHRDGSVVALRVSRHRPVAVRIRVRPVRRWGGSDARQQRTRGVSDRSHVEVAVRGLTVEFPSNAGSIRALDDVSLDLRRGKPWGWSERAASESRCSCARS